MGLLSGEAKWQGRQYSWVARHSLGLVLAVLLIAQTIYAVWSGSIVWANEDPFQAKDPALTADFWVWWSWEYNVSLVADTFGVLLIVMLSKWFYEQGSAESTSK